MKEFIVNTLKIFLTLMCIVFPIPTVADLALCTYMLDSVSAFVIKFLGIVIGIILLISLLCASLIVSFDSSKILK